MRILILLTDAFGGFGGISRYNRDFLTALDTSPLVEKIYVWPRTISEPIAEPIPESIIYECKFANNKVNYVCRGLLETLLGSSIDLVICSHINLLPFARIVSAIRRIPLVLMIYGIEAWAPKRFLYRSAIASVSSVVSISAVSANRFSSWSMVPAEKISIIPCCVDLNTFTPGPKPTELVSRYNLQGKDVLLTVGRLASEERYKGFDQVIEALPQLTEDLPNLRYIIGGDGPDATRLKKKVSELQISDNVIFVGRIPESEKVAHYRLADVYVMPSSGEGFGIVLLEAAACGISVIGSKADGTAEALLGGRLGPLVDPSSKSELKRAIIDNLISSNHRGVRNPAVGYFGFNEFCRRVRGWLNELNDQLVHWDI